MWSSFATTILILFVCMLFMEWQHHMVPKIRQRWFCGGVGLTNWSIPILDYKKLNKTFCFTRVFCDNLLSCFGNEMGKPANSFVNFIYPINKKLKLGFSHFLSIFHLINCWNCLLWLVAACTSITTSKHHLEN